MQWQSRTLAERQTLTRRVRGAERQNDKDGKMTCDVTIQVGGPLVQKRYKMEEKRVLMVLSLTSLEN